MYLDIYWWHLALVGRGNNNMGKKIGIARNRTGMMETSILALCGSLNSNFFLECASSTLTVNLKPLRQCGVQHSMFQK